MVQWLGLWASTAGDTGVIPGGGAKIPRVASLKQKKGGVSLIIPKGFLCRDGKRE